MYNMMIQIHCFRLLISSMVAFDMLILHALIVIIFIPFVKSSQELLRKDLNGITWDQAQDACKPHGLENREGYLRESGILNNHEFWIGKTIDRIPTRWIELIGCFEIVEVYINSFPEVTSIGYCQQKCYSDNPETYFGYKQYKRGTKTNNCVCLPSGLVRIQQRDILYCLNTTDFFVYKGYNGSVRQSSDPGNCTTICCGTCNGINGNHLEGRRCSSVDNNIVGRCVLGTQHFKWDSDYYESLDYCMQKNRLLPSSDYCQQSDNNTVYQGQLSWTNVFREEVDIIRTQDFSEVPDRCISGIFILVQGQRTLNITEHKCNENKHWYICKPNNSLYNMYTTEASLVNTIPGLQNSQRDDENVYTQIGAVIGGILGACCILTTCISTIIIVCKIRSRRNINEFDQHKPRESSQLPTSKTINNDSTNAKSGKSIQAESIKIIDLCETGLSGYSVANNLNKPENLNEIYTESADGEYDILHDKQKRRMCPTENVYHSHGAHQNEDCFTYDSADFGKENANDRNRLYYTSFSVVDGNYSYMSYDNRDNELTTDIYDKST